MKFYMTWTLVSKSKIVEFSTNFDILFIVSTEMELVLRQLNVQIKEVQLVVIVLLGKSSWINIDVSNENDIENIEICTLLFFKWGNSEEHKVVNLKKYNIVPPLEDASLKEVPYPYTRTYWNIYSIIVFSTYEFPQYILE